MDSRHDKAIEAVLEQLIEHGPEGIATVFARTFEMAMLIERERFLGAGHYGLVRRHCVDVYVCACVIVNVVCTGSNRCDFGMRGVLAHVVAQRLICDAALTARRQRDEQLVSLGVQSEHCRHV